MRIKGLERFDPIIINGLRLYGYPLLSLESKNSKSVEEIVKTTGGEFLVIDEKKGEFAIDLLGQFRMYWRIEKDELSLFRDYDVNEINSLGYQKSIQSEEEISILGYCVAEKTIYEGNFKVLPLYVYGNKKKKHIYINNLKSLPIRESLIHSIKFVIENYSGKDNCVALMYSGGKDSSYLARLLNELSIKYNAYSIVKRKKDFNEVRRNALKDGVRNLEIFYFDTEDVNQEINTTLINELHPAQMLFQCISKIKESLILNGQNADSLLALGPSETSFLSFIRRIIIRERGRGIISKLIALVSNYSKVEGIQELFMTSMYSHKYVFLKYLLVEKYLYDYENFKINFEAYSKLEIMYLGKILGFIQGPDSQVLYRISDILDKRVILPFSHPYILGKSIADKYSSQIFFPKQILRK